MVRYGEVGENNIKYQLGYELSLFDLDLAVFITMKYAINN